ETPDPRQPAPRFQGPPAMCRSAGFRARRKWARRTSEVQKILAEAAVAVTLPQQATASQFGSELVQHSVHGDGVHEAREEEAVATHSLAGLLEVVRDFTNRADDRIAGTTAACLQDLAQGRPRRGCLGEVLQRALVAVGAQFRQRRIEVELLEVDHGQVGDRVELAVDITLGKLPALRTQLLGLG